MNQSEVDVNILIGIYNQRISGLINQNVLLEAKIQSLIKDFSEDKNKLLMVNLDLQKKIDCGKVEFERWSIPSPGNIERQ